MTCKVDFLVIGAGVLGLSIAKELKQKNPRASITILEKEVRPGMHASGRNSGVLHSGIFYSDNSLKAKLCAEGAREWYEYCQERHLPVKRCGKIIVPTHETEENRLQELLVQAQKRGIQARLVTQNELVAEKIEPDVISATGHAIHLPNVAIVDPSALIRHLAEELQSQGIQIFYEQLPISVDSNRLEITTKNETFVFGHLFNCAGLHADTLAQQFDSANFRYTILPFKGLYYQVAKQARLTINGLVYAVPDPKVPFLGIHYMRRLNDHVYLGPTVLPAFGRENYSGLEGITSPEAFRIMRTLAKLYYVNHQGFRTFSHREIPRFFKSGFYHAAKLLTPNLKLEDLTRDRKVGIRAQLLDLTTNELVMDFLITQSKRATHILNAVSPGFTSAFPFARFVLDQIGIH